MHEASVEPPWAVRCVWGLTAPFRYERATIAHSSIFFVHCQVDYPAKKMYMTAISPIYCLAPCLVTTLLVAAVQ